jgi:hypothetical protein
MDQFGISDAIVYDAEGERLIFGVEVEGGGYASVFGITKSGDLQVFGKLLEQGECDAIEMSSCWEATTTYFALSLNGRDAVMVYMVEEESLYLTGRVRENTNFNL